MRCDGMPSLRCDAMYYDAMECLSSFLTPAPHPSPLRFAQKQLGFVAGARHAHDGEMIQDRGPLVPTVFILPSAREGGGSFCVFSKVEKIARAKGTKLISVAIGARGQGDRMQECFEEALEKRYFCFLENW